MTYEEWLEQLEKNGKALRARKAVLTKAAQKCSPETQKDLSTFLDKLDLMFSVEKVPEGMELLEEQEEPRLTKDDFDRVRLGMGSEIGYLVHDFRTPVEFLSQKGVKEALMGIVKAADAESRVMKPDFVDRVSERRKACDASPIQVAAHYYAFKDTEGVSMTMDQLFRVLPAVSRWAKDPVLNKTLQDKNAVAALRDGTPQEFEGFYQKTVEQEFSKTRSFREWSDEIAKRYRNRDITYAQLELEMSALRALAPGKNDNEREKQQISIGDFRKKTAELEQQRTGKLDSAAYQKQLADSYREPQEISQDCLDELYGMKLEFHPEYVPRDSNLGYTKDNFDKYMPSFDMDVKVGGKSVSNREFASLSMMALYDLSIAGSYVYTKKVTEPIEIEPNKWVAADNQSLYVMGLANNYKEINGKTVATPDERCEHVIHGHIPAARNMTKNALEAYKKGDVGPLAKLIAHGIDMRVNYGAHSAVVLSGDGVKGRYPRGDWTNQNVMARLNTDQSGNDMAMQGTMALLERDAKLKKAVMDAGLKEADLVNARGFQVALQVQKAGVTAMDRLSEDADGRRKLSGPEKEQCVLAIQRMQAMMKNLQEAQEAGLKNEEYLKEYEKYSEEEDELSNQAEENNIVNYFQTPEGARRFKPRTHEISVRLNMAIGIAPVFRELAEGGIAAMDARITTQDCRAARNMTSSQIMDGFQTANGIFNKDVREIKTTAKDIYDQLTKRYKAGELPYERYEERLRTMREITGDNPKARIDLPTIDEVIEKERRTRIGPVEAKIEDMMETDQGTLARRVRNIDDAYGLTPKINLASLPSTDKLATRDRLAGYTREQFEQLQPIKEGPGENHLHLSEDHVISQEEFSALGVAATQTFPEIGCVYVTMESKKTNRPNIITKPTLDGAAGLRSSYTTDLDQGDGSARDGMGWFIGTTIVPARQKVEEALRSYRAGKGSPKMLGKILGVGLHQTVTTTQIANPENGELKPDYLVDSALVSRLVEIAEKDPALMKETMKYTTKEEINKAKGLGMLYKLTVGAELAKEKLAASASGKQKLTADERKACVELLLRQKVLRDRACQQGKANATKEKTDAIYQDYLLKTDDINRTKEDDVHATAEFDLRNRQLVGLPDYLEMLGVKGGTFARDMLEGVMPNRDAFFEKSDDEILKALEERYGSPLDPFMNKEYTTKPVVEQIKAQNEPQRETRLEKSDSRAAGMMP